MKRFNCLLAAGALALASGCVSPTITYHRTLDDDQAGQAVMTLQTARIAIAPPGAQRPASTPAAATTPAAAAPAAAARPGARAPAPAATPATPAAPASDGATTPNFTVSHHDNTAAAATLFVEPFDGLWSLTQLAPTYRANSSQFATLGVQTIDRRKEFAEDIVGIVSAFGDATFLADAAGSSPYISCVAIEPEWIRDQLANKPREQEVQAMALPRASTSPACRIDAYFSPLPTDAIALTDISVDDRTSYLLIEACRRITIDYRYYATSSATVVHTRWVGYVPDPAYARRAPLPYSGTLDRSNVCSPPTLTLGESKPAAPFSVFRNILAPFRNPD